MSAFARAVDSLFSKLGVTAIFQPRIGANIAVTIIAKRPDEIIGLAQHDIATEVTLFDLRTAEVAEPKAEDIIFFQGTEYRIIGEPQRDIHRLIWTMEAVKI